MRLSSYSQESPTADRPAGLSGNPARDLAGSFNIRVIFFLSLHIPLALVANLSPWISAAYALIALLYGLRAALSGRTSQVVYAVSYIAAGEVLWRMTHAYLFWEFSKYAAVLILFIAIIIEWNRKPSTRRLRSISPVVLMAAFVPAIAYTTLVAGVAEARDQLSFNLSSYLMIAISALYLWARPIDYNTTVRMLLAILAPVVASTSLAIYLTVLDMSRLVFIGESNWITSGNYGPNQVSNMMGFGAFVAIALFIMMPRAWGARIFVLLLSVVMLIQGLLTFSRGGIYSFILALGVFSFHLMRTPKARGRLVLLFAVFTALLALVVYPTLERFTAGGLAQRFADLNTTGRFEAAQIDLEAFLDNPFLGVGVGQADAYRAEYFGKPVAAHTEFTRLLGEHGVFGIVVLAILAWMILKRYLANDPGMARAIAAGFSVWGLSVMVHAATRLAAVPLALSLAFVFWKVKAETEPVEPEHGQPLLIRPDERILQ